MSNISGLVREVYLVSKEVWSSLISRVNPSCVRMTANDTTGKQIIGTQTNDTLLKTIFKVTKALVAVTMETVIRWKLIKFGNNEHSPHRILHT